MHHFHNHTPILPHPAVFLAQLERFVLRGWPLNGIAGWLYFRNNFVTALTIRAAKSGR